MKRWVPWILAALLLACLTAPSAEAAGKRRSTVHARLSTRHFDARPAMAIIPDTRVYYLRDESEFDLYRYGGSWYLVEDGLWYRARTWRGPFRSVTRGSVPRAVLGIPAGYRRNWIVVTSPPKTKSTIAVGEPYPGSTSAGDEPRMAIIPDTRVYYLREESDHDLYRLEDTWYMVKAGGWFTANTWRGPFRPIRVADVPGEIRNIPPGFRRNWVTPGTPVKKEPESY